jgi:hypothetical protein
MKILDHIILTVYITGIVLDRKTNIEYIPHNTHDIVGTSKEKIYKVCSMVF